MLNRVFYFHGNLGNLDTSCHVLSRKKRGLTQRVYYDVDGSDPFLSIFHGAHP